MKEYRSCAGCLQWLSSNSRPDLAAGTSLMQKGSTEVSNLKEMYSLIRYARETALVGITIKPVPLYEILVCAYGDSSWANAAGLRSQTGYIVLVTSREALYGREPASIMDWGSNRTNRVVRSTLAAEAAAADKAIDRAVYVSYMFDEAIYRRPATLRQSTVPVIAITDCRSLFDAVQQMTPSLEEKRTILDITSIREHIAANNFRWVPSAGQHADGLTKLDRSLMQRLTALMQSPYVRLQED